MNDKINIVFASDDNYAQHIAVVIASIMAKTKEKVCFFVINDNISSEKITKLKNTAVKLNTTVEFIAVPEEQFKNVLFPIGEMEKSEVRKIAHEYDLITADKKDSTGICFIGERNFKHFLENYLPNNPGDIVDIESGKVLGKHLGLMYYTLGQRRGLNIGGTKDRLFVVKKDLDKNVLYVASGDENKYLISYAAIIEDVNLLDELPSECMAKFRYRQKDICYKTRGWQFTCKVSCRC